MSFHLDCPAVWEPLDAAVQLVQKLWGVVAPHLLSLDISHSEARPGCGAGQGMLVQGLACPAELLRLRK